MLKACRVFVIALHLAVTLNAYTAAATAADNSQLTAGSLDAAPLDDGHKISRKLLQQDWQVSFPFVSQRSNESNSTVAAAPAANPTECPKITLRLNTIEIYDGVVNDPAGLISVQCYSRTGQQFAPIQFYALAASVRSALGARYTPNLNVAQLSCGEEASCRISVGKTSRRQGEGGGTTVSTWRELVEGGCWFDYRHFTQLSYREQMSAWTCNRPPTRYTLECVECAQPDFPWDIALANGGPPLTDESSTVPEFGFNSTMIVVSIVVCSVAVVLVGLALFVRHRRRGRESDRRMLQMIEQAREARSRAVPPGYKPPAMFVIGEVTDGKLPLEYQGPIVVLNYGEDEDEEMARRIISSVTDTKDDKSIKNKKVDVQTTTTAAEVEIEAEATRVFRDYPMIAIAKPEVSSSPLASGRAGISSSRRMAAQHQSSLSSASRVANNSNSIAISNSNNNSSSSGGNGNGASTSSRSSSRRSHSHQGDREGQRRSRRSQQTLTGIVNNTAVENEDAPSPPPLPASTPTVMPTRQPRSGISSANNSPITSDDNNRNIGANANDEEIAFEDNVENRQ